MRLSRLAQIFEMKYSFKKEGAESIAQVMHDVKRDLISAYNLYVNSDTAKEPILQMLANKGEPFCRALVANMEETIANLDVLAANPSVLFKHVNKMLGAIHEVKNDPDKRVRNFIHDSVRVTKESEKNFREHMKSKFEMILLRLSTVLEKQAKILKGFMGTDEPLAGGMVEPQRKELSKEKLLMFMKSRAAKMYGLDMDVMSVALTSPEFKQKLTTLINAIDRGHVPVDGPEVYAEAQAIRKWFDEQKQTNLPALEQTPQMSPSGSLFEEDKE
jgi:hypothetical protein